MYRIHQLTGKQVEELQAKYPKGEIKQFQLVEAQDTVDGGLVLSYHAFKADAEEELIRWQGRDKITAKLDEYSKAIEEIAVRHGIELDEARQMMKAYY